ncbi:MULTISPECIES: EAL domain-containing protein [unclassified Ectothiorhodospira]|uniref:EAL domain-containing protein n=1 Tax=unclassified Ectothiorhodospira TaxID=2684909 RepID=UPI001EE7C582|nr:MULTISPECIES: EAL domain-containing protein [unclassified Ectothiorhodospira]MCG5515181.1 EAL domain-containing protein [Ectothiorhodospira sp. 9100]MCG5519508.1 EAL domain-containing protein [Ectothiorhodospira sp. 9905]
MRCVDCQVIERSSQGPGSLFLAPFLSHTLKALKRQLNGLGVPARETHPGVLEVPVSTGGPGAMDATLRQHLSEAEIIDCRAVFLPEGEAFTLATLPHTQSLMTLLARAGSGWLADLIEAERFIFHFQPIVHCQDPAHIFAHEALVRGYLSDEDRSLVFPDRLFGQARASRMMFQLDRAARVNAIRQAVGHGFDGRVFINFNPTTIYDPTYCLKTTLDEVERLGADADRLVFEVVESEEVSDSGHLRRIVDFYREAGFQVALDDLGAGYASLNLLSELKPDFVKFDRALVSQVDQDAFKQKVLAKLIEMAHDLGITTIAEGVEEKAEWQWLKAHAVDYVQGYLFARPGSPPPRPVVPT